ncbi:hypothetical protein AB990_17020 [Alkalihalobacillus pseudalcaliphilus]|nr:hypothetical protein AB990_17020 [Alkalihalobacillus pseudalcaliphilus]
MIVGIVSIMIIFDTFFFKGELEFKEEAIPEDALVINGYVVAKRFSSVWISEEPVPFFKRVAGFLKGNYGSSTIIVTKHEHFEGSGSLRSLSVNQPIRVYGDYLRESFPGQISAYGIKEIE